MRRENKTGIEKLTPYSIVLALKQMFNLFLCKIEYISHSYVKFYDKNDQNKKDTLMSNIFVIYSSSLFDGGALFLYVGFAIQIKTNLSFLTGRRLLLQIIASRLLLMWPRENQIQCLDLYSFLPNCCVSCRFDVISAKNCTIPDTGVWPGILQLFAESYPAISERPQKFGKKLYISRCNTTAWICTVFCRIWKSAVIYSGNFRQLNVQIQAAVLHLETYSFLPKMPNNL